jgi:hypothetical protein
VVTTKPLTDSLQQGIRILYTLLKVSPEFRLLFADRLQRHFFNGGALTATRVLSRLGELRNEFVPLLNGSAFNDRVTPWVNGVGDSSRYTLSNGTSGSLVNAPSRLRVLFQGYTDDTAGGALVPAHLVAEGLWPSTQAPRFSQFGGTIPAGSPLTLSNPNHGGTIYFTTDGSDPREVGGAARGSAYNGPLALQFPTTVRARVLLGSVWSPLTEAFFDTGTTEPLLVTEVMYHPSDDGAVAGDEFEFLELKNTGTAALDLAGIRFSEGISHAFPASTTLAPGGHLVLARNPAHFAARYPAVALAGSWDPDSQLANDGERLTLVNAAGRTVFSVAWTDTAPWPEQADGHGRSLVPANPDANPAPDDPTSWRPSTNLLGSPGADDPPPPASPVHIHELLPRPLGSDSARIELHNPNPLPVDLSHWGLSDDEAVPLKYRLPPGTVLAGGAFLVLSHADYAPSGLGFDWTGGTALLSAADSYDQLTGYRHTVDFGASEPGVSFGRHLNSVGAERFVAQVLPTFGAPNAGPRVGPVVISEIMYHPTDAWVDEFVELRNTSQAPVPLFDPDHPENTWHLEGTGFNFPPGIVLQPGQIILLSAIEPETFRARHLISPAVSILGPYPGSLGNGGELLALQKPGPPFTPPGGMPTVPRIDVDALVYQDVVPWPTAADGGGPSLERLAANAYADDPANWRASEQPGGSPGLPAALSFAAWRLFSFTPAQLAAAGVGGHSDDPDADGLTNLAEWAFASNPLRPAAAPVSWHLESVDGRDHLTLRVRVSRAAAGLAVCADSSPDLIDWLPGGGIPTAAPVDHGDGTETLSFRLPDPAAEHPCRFLRVRFAAP